MTAAEAEIPMMLKVPEVAVIDPLVSERLFNNVEAPVTASVDDKVVAPEAVIPAKVDSPETLRVVPTVTAAEAEMPMILKVPEVAVIDPLESVRLFDIVEAPVTASVDAKVAAPVT